MGTIYCLRFNPTLPCMRAKEPASVKMTFPTTVLEATLCYSYVNHCPVPDDTRYSRTITTQTSPWLGNLVDVSSASLGPSNLAVVIMHRCNLRRH